MKTIYPRLTWLYRVGATATLISLVLFIIGAVGIITEGLLSTTANDLFGQLQNNWLIVLFKLNAGIGETKMDFKMETLVIYSSLTQQMTGK